ncbi:MAG: hypothetical protein HYR85_16120 [Planctomycetes bacterium]|nr:hypothetical protein [Planctomycetota bacterium]MBI3846206.1 hypothetical protein [Planctomycetota bacterium]
MWIGGVDEAGYGPSLGPLVSSLIAVRVEGTGVDGWQVFGDAVRQPGSRATGDSPRALVGDSKVVYRSGGGVLALTALETSVLAFLEAMDFRPRDLDDFLATVAPGCLWLLADYPWYSDHALPIPVSARADVISACADPIRRRLDECGGTLRVRVSPLLEGEFNRRCAVTANKATALFDVFAGLLADFRAWSTESDGDAFLVVDRHGGRSFYAPLLQSTSPAVFVAIEGERRGRSDYRLFGNGRSLRVSFRERADASSFEVALASLFSKYTRELLMILFNRYWRAQRPGLRPTAGYAEDARRFLSDIAEDLERLGIDRARLVRSR